LSFLNNLKAHHDQEEEALFPLLKPKVPAIDTRHEEHVVLADAMTTARAYLTTVQAEGAPAWSASRFTEAFGPVVEVVLPHVTAEEGDVAPGALRAAGIEDDEARAVLAAMAEEGMKADRTTVLAFMLVHLTREERAAFFGKMPWAVHELVMPVYTLPHAGWWRFAAAAPRAASPTGKDEL
ncbi:hypothetical protein HK405_014523, partial [Cladochytrium tenue]